MEVRVRLLKKTLDIPEDLFEQIMDFAHQEKLYKFTPAVLSLLRKGLEQNNGSD